MTFETQTFVSPQDIIALRFQCPCGAKLSLPISERFRDALLGQQKCTNCHQYWIQGDQDQRFSHLVNLVNSINAVQEASKDFKFNVMIELAPEPSPSSRA